MAQKRRGPERGRGTEGPTRGPGPGKRLEWEGRAWGGRPGRSAGGEGGGPRAPWGPQGREEGDAVPGRDVTTLGRTHETLVEADQPRLPVVVENQNRLNHLCRPRSSPPGCVQKPSTSATTRTLPVGAPRKVPRRKRCPAPRGRTAKSPASRSRRRIQGPRGGSTGGKGGWWGPRDTELGRVVSAVSLAGTRARIGVLCPGRPPASPSSWEKQVPTQDACAKRRGPLPFSPSASRHDALLFPL